MDKKDFLVSEVNVRIPTLLIGIGGIGGRIVQNVYKELNVLDRSTVEMLVLDTNMNDLSDVIDLGIPSVQTSQNSTVLDYLMTNENYRSWFPSNPLINDKNLIDGAGQIRAVSRLGALASEHAGEFETIKECIDRLNRARGNALTTNVKVMIVGSVTGGTGSGVGVQLPFLIKDYLKDFPNVLVRGLFLTADITEAKQKTENSKKAVYVNEYAFIRELNAFYRAQLESDIDLFVEHYPAKDPRIPKELRAARLAPYDFLFLVNKNDKNGNNIGGLAAYESKAAKIIKSQLFSPVSKGQYSAEDNVIIASVQKNGMCRYCGAGYSRAIYPQERVERYCTLRHAERSVSEFWLAIDRRFEEANRERRRMMASDPTLKPVKKREFFVNEFEAMTSENAKDVPYNVAQLRRELFRERVDMDGNALDSVFVIDDLLNNINEFIAECQANMGLTEFKEKCSFNPGDYDDVSDGIKNMGVQMANLRMYKEKAKTAVQNLSTTCAEAIFPSTATPESDAATKDFPYSVYTLLKNCHPLTGRYLACQLIKAFEDKKFLSDNVLQNTEVDAPFAKDFFPYDKEGNIDTPSQALEKTRPGVLRTFVSENLLGGKPFNSKKYKEVVKTFGEAHQKEKNNIDNIIINRLYSNIYDNLIQKLTVMADIYEEFFDGMEVVIADNKKDITSIESKYDTESSRIVDGDLYVCADSLCLNHIFSQVENECGAEANELSADVKKNLFAEIYGEMAKRRADEYEDFGVEKSVRDIFESGVLEPMKEALLAKGSRYTDVGILGAIKAEYNIKRIANEKNPTGTFNFKDERSYMDEIFRRISQLSTPNLGYKNIGESEIPVTISYGINTSCIVKHFGHQKASEIVPSEVEDLFYQPMVQENTPILADSFDKNEVCCYKAVYNLTVENLSAYADGYKAHKEYTERLKNVVGAIHEVNTNDDAYLSTVHPHLDKRWHSVAHLPMVNKVTHETELRFVKLAFLLSFVLGNCRYGKDDEYGYCWMCEMNKRLEPIYTNINEVMSENGLDALLDSFHYNEILQKYVIKKIRDMEIKELSTEALTGTTEERILEHAIIKKFYDMDKIIIKNSNGDVDTSGIKTIFDLIYVLNLKTRSYNLAEKLCRVFAGYLADYCGLMCDNKSMRTLELMQAVAKKIQECSVNYENAKDDTPNLRIFWDGLFTEDMYKENDEYIDFISYNLINEL